MQIWSDRSTASCNTTGVTDLLDNSSKQLQLTGGRYHLLVDKLVLFITRSQNSCTSSCCW
jgi:hypothetical protein